MRTQEFVRGIAKVVLMLLVVGGLMRPAEAEVFLFSIPRTPAGLPSPPALTDLQGVAVDAGGNMYISQGGPNSLLSSVAKLGPDGGEIWRIGAPGSGDGQFSGPFGIAFDDAGNLYVADVGNNRIQKFDANGAFLLAFGSGCHLQLGDGCVDPDGPGPLEAGDGQFLEPRDVAVDGAGNIYVVDGGNHRIQKFDAAGNFLLKFGSLCALYSGGSTCVGAGDGQFYLPQSLAVTSSGTISVADTYNYRIQKFDADGTFLLKLGTPGSGPDQFGYVLGLALDGTGTLYAADTLNRRIQKFDADGGLLQTFGTSLPGDPGEGFGPWDVALDGAGTIHAAGYAADFAWIRTFDPLGRPLATLGTGGTGDGQLSYPGGLALDAGGNLSVVSGGVQRFAAGGAFLGRVPLPGAVSDGCGSYVSNLYLAVPVDSAGNYYVPTGPKIQKLDPDGNVLLRFGLPGRGTGYLSHNFGPDVLAGLAVDGAGNLHTITSPIPGVSGLRTFQPSGECVSSLVIPGGIPHSVSGYSLAVDSQGRRYSWTVRADALGHLRSNVDVFFGAHNGQTFFRTIQVGRCGGAGWGGGDVVVNAADQLYVVDPGQHCVMKFGPFDPNNPSSPPLLLTFGSFGSGPGQFDFRWGGGIALDQVGNVYIADSGNHRIQKFDPAGNLLASFGTPGTGDGQLNLPNLVAVDQAGHVYVADGGRSSNHRIQKFAANGTFLARIAGPGSREGEVSYVYGLAIDGAGHLYVADRGNGRVQKFDASGRVILTPQFATPSGAAVTPAGTLVIADRTNHNIQTLDANGNLLSRFGSWCILDTGANCVDPDGPGPLELGDGQLYGPGHVAVDAQGNIYVADSWNRRAQKFDRDGNFVLKIADWPMGVAVDGSGNLYVVGGGAAPVRKFDAQGNFRSSFGGLGVGDGEFHFTAVEAGIVVDGSGRVFVSDPGNHRVHVFGPGDTTPPAITVAAPANGATFLLNQAVAASYTCTDASGVASCTGPVPSGSPLDTASVGPKVFTVTATDTAGNTTSVSRSYQVVYAFTGFLPPVDNPPALNTVQAGRAIPVKFSLGGYQGLDIFATGYPRSAAIACGSATLEDAIEETVTAGSSALTYDASTAQYSYVWKTNKTWANTCRQLILKLKDGASRGANFKLR